MHYSPPTQINAIHIFPAKTIRLNEAILSYYSTHELILNKNKNLCQRIMGGTVDTVDRAVAAGEGELLN